MPHVNPGLDPTIDVDAVFEKWSKSVDRIAARLCKKPITRGNGSVLYMIVALLSEFIRFDVVDVDKQPQSSFLRMITFVDRAIVHVWAENETRLDYPRPVDHADALFVVTKLCRDLREEWWRRWNREQLRGS